MHQRRDQRPYNVRYYHANREREIARVKRRAQKDIQLLRELRQVPCADCQRTFPPHAMDFDHRDPKSKSFELLRRAGSASRSRLMAEVDKCDVVCANCHRVRTYAQFLDGRLRPQAFVRTTLPAATPDLAQRRERWRTRWQQQSQLIAQLRNVPCADCRLTYPAYVLEFDHRDPSAKRFEITQKLGRVKTAALLQEAAKCDIVCVNCHRSRTERRRWAARE